MILILMTLTFEQGWTLEHLLHRPSNPVRTNV